MPGDGTIGIPVERQHHEVATAGQAEIDFRFDTASVKTADTMMLYKYIIKNVARKHGKTVTFMPKPLFGDNGSGMHTHPILLEKGKPLFAGKEYAGLSQMALVLHRRHFETRQGTVRHLQSDDQQLQAFGPGLRSAGEPGLQRAQSSAASASRPIQRNPKAKRIEYRPPDPAANPYLAFTALLMAGLGWHSKPIDPGEPLDKNLYELPPEELAKVPKVPDSLSGSDRSAGKRSRIPAQRRCLHRRLPR